MRLVLNYVPVVRNDTIFFCRYYNAVITRSLFTDNLIQVNGDWHIQEPLKMNEALLQMF